MMMAWRSFCVRGLVCNITSTNVEYVSHNVSKLNDSDSHLLTGSKIYVMISNYDKCLSTRLLIDTATNIHFFILINVLIRV